MKERKMIERKTVTTIKEKLVMMTMKIFLPLQALLTITHSKKNLLSFSGT